MGRAISAQAGLELTAADPRAAGLVGIAVAEAANRVRVFLEFGQAVSALLLGALLQRGPQVEEHRGRVGEVVQLFEVDEHAVDTGLVIFPR